MDAAPIRVAGLHKHYAMGQNVVRALAGVDLEIEPRTLSVVLGPSGSGKSTLLHLLGGLDRPTEGSIRIGEQRLEDLDENALAIYRRTHVGFVFQSFNLLPSMTAQENVAFPLRFGGVPPRRRNQRAAELLSQVGLADRAQHRPDELSGGQLQRVAVARALVNDPQVVLADEPTGNLDTVSGYQIMELLSDLHRQGRTVVVVSHDPRMTHFATHTICLLDGRVVPQAEYDAAQEVSAARHGSIQG